MTTPYLITLGQAAKQAKVAKSTITRAIEKGELSFKEKTETGSYRIDPSEVDRWVSNRPKQPSQDPDIGQIATPSETVETAVKAAVLAQEVEHLKEMLDLQKKRAEAAEAERDAWREQASILARLPAPAPQSAPEAPPSPSAPSRRGFFGWLRKSPSA